MVLRALTLAVLAIAAAPAQAACSISVTGPIFGLYDPLSPAPLDAAGRVELQCTGTPVPVLISRGSSPTFSPRLMRSGSSTLAYNLYVDAARVTIWGDGTSGTSFPLALPGRQRILPIYGRIPPLQDAAPGSYVDSLVLTFLF